MLALSSDTSTLIPDYVAGSLVEEKMDDAVYNANQTCTCAE